MKKTLTLLLALICALSLTACNLSDLKMEDVQEVLDILEQLESLQSSTDDASSDSETSSNTAVSDQTGDRMEDWISLIGYWHAADGQFFLLDMADSHTAYLEEGIWDTSYSRGGYIENLAQTESYVYEGTVHFPAVEGNEMDDPKPAADLALTVDYSGLDNDGKINITLDGVRCTCAYAGKTAEEAYAVHQQNMSDIAGYTDELSQLWQSLLGCWEADGTYFVEFSFRDGKPALLAGSWGNPVPAGREAGYVSELVKSDAGHYYTAKLFYPPVKEPADAQDLITHSFTIMLGVEELQKGNLDIQATDTQLRSYHRVADSYEQAMQTRG